MMTLPVPRTVYSNPGRLCLEEIRAFVDGDQLDLLYKVLKNILREFGQNKYNATRILLEAGLDDSQVRKMFQATRPTFKPYPSHMEILKGSILPVLPTRY